MPPSVIRRASIRIANWPSGPSNATLVSSAFSIVPPRANTGACHSQLPVMSQA